MDREDSFATEFKVESDDRLRISAFISRHSSCSSSNISNHINGALLLLAPSSSSSATLVNSFSSSPTGCGSNGGSARQEDDLRQGDRILHRKIPDRRVQGNAG
jgi:hypothetical protein